MLVERVRVRPREHLLRPAERPLVVVERVQPRADHHRGGKRLDRLVMVERVPPRPPAELGVPARTDDEAHRAARVHEVCRVVRRLIRVDERQAPTSRSRRSRRSPARSPSRGSSRNRRTASCSGSSRASPPIGERQQRCLVRGGRLCDLDARRGSRTTDTRSRAARAASTAARRCTCRCTNPRKRSTNGRARRQHPAAPRER